MLGGYSLGRIIVHSVAGLGVVKVVNDIIGATAIRDTAFASLKSKVGVVVIGSLMYDVVVPHVDSRIDQMLAAWQEQKTELDAKVDTKLQEVVAKRTEEPS